MTTILETLRPFGITRCYKGFPLTVYAIHLAVMEERIGWKRSQRKSIGKPPTTSDVNGPR